MIGYHIVFTSHKYKKVIAWNKALEIMTNTIKKDILGKGGGRHILMFSMKNPGRLWPISWRKKILI